MLAGLVLLTIGLGSILRSTVSILWLGMLESILILFLVIASRGSITLKLLSFWKDLSGTIL